MPDADESVLDNPAWFALAGSRAPLAVRWGRAARFDPELSPFVGMSDDSDEAWADLAHVLGPSALR